MKQWIFAAFVALTLSGCLTTESPDVTHSSLAILYPPGSGQSTVQVEMALEAGDFPSAELYTEGSHPGYHTAFDQLVRYARSTGIELDVQFSSFGPFLNAIGPVAGYNEGSSGAYWALNINGAASELGMGELRVIEGDSISWTYEEYSF